MTNRRDSGASGWLRAALGVGVAYLLIGLGFGSLAGNAATTATRTRWRMAAWLISGSLFLAQIVYERLRLRHSATASSLHSAAAAAVGGFLLAGSATVNKMASGHVDGRYAIALVAWPLLTAVPAFVVAFALALIVRPRR